jgi:hypothetical protein
MEEMSKKTKRLEKENLNLTRKQEATNKNIFQMAEERSQSQQAIDRLTRENEKLKKLCRAMQTSGYGNPSVVTAHGQAEIGADEFDEGLEGETESEYDDEEYDEDEGDYEDDTEEETEALTYAPPPPPPQAHDQVPNGKARGPLRQQQQQQQAQAIQVNGANVANGGSRH